MPIKTNEFDKYDCSPFEKQMPQVWGDWGCSSEIGRLRAVILHRPGPEIENLPQDLSSVLFMERMDPIRAGEQHDAMAEIYRQNGVAVHYIEKMPLNKPNGMFARDLAAMTPEGLIIARPGTMVRRGEERYLAETAASLGVPILRTIAGSGTFEGADLYLVNRDLAVISLSRRTNEAGAQQVKAELERMGWGEILTVDIAYSEAHIDGQFGVLDRDLAIVYTRQAPFRLVDALRRHGFRILEVESEEDVIHGFGLNFVPLEPGRILTPKAENQNVAKMMRQAGVEVIQVDVTEIMKGGGSVHCMTQPIKRDEL